ncbi:hypothetical protein H0X32_02210 [Patescibacteria group bacterium]|nr:hypothetical protein [Patescibacteria group bacterium]
MKKLNLARLSTVTRIFRYGDRIHPSRDWFVLLAFALLLLVISIGFNVWLFMQIAGGKSIVSDTSVPHVASSTTSVTDVQNVFKGRASEETNYQHTYHFVDPSLPGS